jgi:predicted nucleic acid-binding protein
MNKYPVIIADADAIIAIAHANDAHHMKAMQISEKLEHLQAQVLYPATAIAEAATFIERVLLNTAMAFGTVSLLTSLEAQVVEVNKQVLVEAIQHFSPHASKKNTMFDCIIAAIARREKADAVFSFDRFYKKNGFALAEEL